MTGDVVHQDGMLGREPGDQHRHVGAVELALGLDKVELLAQPRGALCGEARQADPFPAAFGRRQILRYGAQADRRIVEIIYMQAHWAFYRAACILLLANRMSDDVAVYWGTNAGLVLTFVEAWADPRVRRYIAQLGEGDIPLWSAAQAILNAVGFILTRNVWILALLHLVMEFTVPHLRAVPPPTPEPVTRRASQAKPKPPRAQPARVKSTKTR